MAKSPAPKAAADKVSVRLKCVYSGFPGNPGPGDVIGIDREEADRLVGLGVAELVTE